VLNNKDIRHFVVKVENDAFKTPVRIHRKEFYSRQNVRRIIEGDIFKDTLYKIQREIPSTTLVNFLSEKLEERFVFKLQMEVV